MSEYIPTTEEVREIYWQSGYKTTVEQFDRWLAQVKADAVAEFIIENVKEFRNSTFDDRKLGQCCAHCKDPHCYGCECDEDNE